MENNDLNNQPAVYPPVNTEPAPAVPAPAPGPAAPSPASAPAPAAPVQPIPAQPLEAAPVQPAYQPVYQQQYQQVPPQFAGQQTYQQAPPQYAGQPNPSGTYLVNPAMSELDMMTPEERSSRKKKANLLCFISLALHFVPEMLSGAFRAIIEQAGRSSDIASTTEFFTSAFALFTGGAYIASWVLMIIARVKFKESKFAKVLMWVYIGILALGVLAVILVIAMCAYILKDCHGF